MRKKTLLIKLWWHVIDCRTHHDLWGVKMWKNGHLKSEIQCLCAQGRWKSFCRILTASSDVSVRKRSDFGCFSDSGPGPVCSGFFVLGKPSLRLRRVPGLVQPWGSGVGHSVCVKTLRGPGEFWLHLTGFLHRTRRMFGSLQLVPRAYVCCEHEATKNMVLLNKKDIGLESGCAHAYLAGGPGRATLPPSVCFPLCPKGVLVPILNIYINMKENKG